MRCHKSGRVSLKNIINISRGWMKPNMKLIILVTNLGSDSMESNSRIFMNSCDL